MASAKQKAKRGRAVSKEMEQEKKTSQQAQPLSVTFVNTRHTLHTFTQYQTDAIFSFLLSPRLSIPAAAFSRPPISHDPCCCADQCLSFPIASQTLQVTPPGGNLVRLLELPPSSQTPSSPLMIGIHSFCIEFHEQSKQAHAGTGTSEI